MYHEIENVSEIEELESRYWAITEFVDSSGDRHIMAYKGGTKC